MDAIANIMNLFCILFVNIDKTVVCASVKSIKSLSLLVLVLVLDNRQIIYIRQNIEVCEAPKPVK